MPAQRGIAEGERRESLAIHEFAGCECWSGACQQWKQPPDKCDGECMVTRELTPILDAMASYAHADVHAFLAATGHYDNARWAWISH
jgi:hypothetical protein